MLNIPGGQFSLLTLNKSSLLYASRPSVKFIDCMLASSKGLEEEGVAVLTTIGILTKSASVAWNLEISKRERDPLKNRCESISPGG